MRPLQQYHPFTNFIFFLMVILLTGILNHPALTLISFVSALSTFFVFRKKDDHSFIPIFLFCLLIGILNPLFSHHGKTILFYLQGAAITLEAVIYGIFLSFQLLQLILWFKLFSLTMTSEHLMCLFGALSPRLALLFSMVLRFVPDFSRQFKSRENALKTQGRYDSNDIFCTIKCKSLVFLSVAGYSLEKGIITADSMEARGYSLSHRSSARRFKWRKRDLILISCILLLSLPLLISKILNTDATLFYPEFTFRITPPGLLLILLPGLMLTLIPIFTHLKERSAKWKK